MGKEHQVSFWQWFAAFFVAVALMYATDIPALKSQPETIVICCGIAAVFCLGMALRSAILDKEKFPICGRQGRLIAAIAILIFGVLFVGAAAAYFWPRSAAPQNAHLQGDITGMAVFDLEGQPGIVNVITSAEIRSGGEGGYITGFKLKLAFANGEEHESNALPVIEPRTFKKNDVNVEITPETSLWGREGAPAVRGFRSGKLWFPFDGISDFWAVGDNRTRFILTITDSNGQSYTSTKTISELLGPRVTSTPPPQFAPKSTPPNDAPLLVPKPKVPYDANTKGRIIAPDATVNGGGCAGFRSEEGGIIYAPRSTVNCETTTNPPAAPLPTPAPPK